MNSDFLYPAIGDRRSIGEWLEDGRPDSLRRAHDRVRQLLSTAPACVIVPDTRERLVAKFDLVPLLAD